ncbi:MAG: kelch repeat-containing protein [Pseudomonadota bacterium]|nr:kelch repeat-containing protein [Pseudomonadota bacterium]
MLVSVSMLLMGCTGSGGAAYTLHLNPVVANPQAPFDGLDRIDLVLTPADGDPLRVPLDAPTSGSTPEVTGLPELIDTTITVEGYRDGDRVLRGLTEPLTATSGVVEATVFVASTEATAWMGALSDGLHIPMLAPLGGGRFWLAGGLTNDLNNAPGKGQKSIYTLTLAPPGEGLAFTNVGDLPAYETNDGASETTRVGAGCTQLTVSGADQGKLLVTGGAARDPLGDGGEASTAVSLYDPTTDTWEDLPPLSTLEDPRVQHLAGENLLGNVVVWGGYGPQARGGGVSLNNSIEYYDRGNRRFTSLGETNLGPLDAMMADLGADGTLICGGADIDDSVWSSVSSCVRVRLDGSGIDGFESMLEGVAGASMVTLADGKVLVTGGAAAEGASTSDDIGALDSAWLYNPSTGRWGALAATMKIPRAGHRTVLLADGRVLVVGGAQTYNSNVFPADPVRCLEIYDPVASTFELADGCTPTEEAGGLPGGALLPQVAYDPDYGVLIVGGVGADGSAQSGVSLFVPEL